MARRYPSYFIQIDNFDYQPNNIPVDQKSLFRIPLTEIKNADQPLKIVLGEEFRLSSDFTNDFTLRLQSINKKAQEAEFQLLLNTYYTNGPVIQNFTLKKDIPSYIPREITDSQLVLTDIQANQATIKFLPKSSIITWNEREIDLRPEINMNDQRYLTALAYFKTIEEKYMEYSEGKIVKLAPFKYDNAWVYAIGVVDKDSIDKDFLWVNNQELPKKGDLCLLSRFHLDNTEADLAEGRGYGNSIKTCLPSQGSEELPLNF